MPLFTVELLVGGIKPHFYCLPILKREEHRQALLAAVRSGCKRLFLGTDSAPHAKERKECEKGCAGCFSEFLRRTAVWTSWRRLRRIGGEVS